jgi:hypothetical protein
MKRLFDREVLPSWMVQRTAGGHWRVRYSSEELQRCKAALSIWQVWHRKPHAARQHARRGELLKLAIDLIIFDGTRPAPRDAVDEYKATFRALQLLGKGSDNVSGVRWQKQLLKQPNEWFAAVFILRVAALRFVAKWKREPKAAELADAVGISTSSLYRAPFGKTALRLAISDRDIAESEHDPCPDAETSDASNADHPLNTEQISDADADQSPENRRNKAKRDLPVGVHKKPKRKADSTVKPRKRRAKALKMEWDGDGKDGGMLCVFRADSLDLKRLNDSFHERSLSEDGETKRALARRNSRAIRKARNLEYSDPTFGRQCWAAYVKRPDGRFDWWINIDPQPFGVADSANQARSAILTRMARVKTRS